jgi:hypothetical protein
MRCYTGTGGGTHTINPGFKETGYPRSSDFQVRVRVHDLRTALKKLGAIQSTLLSDDSAFVLAIK